MKDVLNFRKSRQAQTLVFFLIAFFLIWLLCGLAIDSGLLYLASSRLSRAVDGAALQAVGNASQTPDSVAQIMRAFAIANYTDLAPITPTPTVTTSTFTNPGTGASVPEYTYTYGDSSAGKDSTGNFRRYVQVVFQLGAGNQITSALTIARCPVKTYFMGYLSGNMFGDLKVASSAVATRNPRLIMVVVDRSASMLSQGGGAYGLPAAVVTFLNFFNTSSDYIGLVSFSSSARLEMPLTTNFLNAGTNDLYDTYQVNSNSVGIPGVDPEEYGNVANYTNGTGTPAPPRRMKFGGQTCADEGLRLAMEQLMSNSGFTNPNVVKYIVLFTDGAWNTVRTMVAAPGYTNIVNYPTAIPKPGDDSVVITPTIISSYGSALPSIGITNYIMPVPTLSHWWDESNSVSYVTTPGNANGFDYQNHTNDYWLSADGINEPLSSPLAQQIGGPATVNNETNYIGSIPYYYNPYGDGKNLDVFTAYLSVWTPPGSVDYLMQGTNVATYVSDYTNPAKTNVVVLNPGQSNVLVVPGYVMEGILSDSLDMPYPDDSVGGSSSYPSYRADGYNEPFMWPDDTNSRTTAAQATAYVQTGSVERELLFRNYVNLLTGYYVLRPDDPLAPSTDTNSFTGAVQPLYGCGAYYPGCGYYFPFDMVGIDRQNTYALANATVDPDPTGTGLARHIAYSINMLSPAAAPEYYGELFYEGTGGTNSFSGTSAASTQITSSSQWQASIPNWTTPYNGLMLSDPTHNSAIGGATWRPISFNGSNNLVTTLSDPNLSTEAYIGDTANQTGGYVTDGTNVYRNTMCYAGRPTHYFDFSTSKWIPLPDNHSIPNIALGLGNWKALEYAWHARQAGVTIFTVGYGSAVNASECSLLAKVANSVTVVTPNGSGTTTNSSSYISGQPVGQQFYATTPTDISNDFYQVGTAISGALTQ